MAKKWLNILRATVKGKKKTFFAKTYTGKESMLVDNINIRVTDSKDNFVGSMKSSMPWDSKRAYVKDTIVHDKYRELGVSTKMFKDTMKKAKSMGADFLHGQELQHPAQVSIRDKFISKFKAYGIGRYGEGEKLVSKSEAQKIIRATESGGYSGSIMGYTKIPKKMGRSEKEILSDAAKEVGNSGKVIFRRIGGRIVPIKVKK